MDAVEVKNQTVDRDLNLESEEVLNPDENEDHDEIMGKIKSLKDFRFRFK